MHRHIWEIESKETQPSAWEQMNTYTPVTNVEHGGPAMFRLAVIVTYKCAICGSQKVERV